MDHEFKLFSSLFISREIRSLVENRLSIIKEAISWELQRSYSFNKKNFEDIVYSDEIFTPILSFL